MKERLSLCILKKDFNVTQHGYKVEEVDCYLDEIMFKVKELEAELDRLNKEKEQLVTLNKVLNDKNVKLQVENTRLQSISNNVTINPDNYNNVEVIERLSKLETAVYNLKRLIENKTNL